MTSDALLSSLPPRVLKALDKVSGRTIKTASRTVDLPGSGIGSPQANALSFCLTKSESPRLVRSTSITLEYFN